MSATKGVALVAITVLTASLATATLTLAPMNLKATTDEDLALELDIDREGEVRKQDIKSAEQSSNAGVEIDIEKRVNEESDAPANTWDRTIDKPGEEDLELSGESAEQSSTSESSSSNAFEAEFVGQSRD